LALPGKIGLKYIVMAIGIASIAGIIMGFVSLYNDFQPYELKIYTHLELDREHVKDYRFRGQFCSYELYQGNQLIKKGFRLRNNMIDSTELANMVRSVEQTKDLGAFMVLIVDKEGSGTEENRQ
jgi:hypothetical protein